MDFICSLLGDKRSCTLCYLTLGVALCMADDVENGENSRQNKWWSGGVKVVEYPVELILNTSSRHLRSSRSCDIKLEAVAVVEDLAKIIINSSKIVHLSEIGHS